MNLGTRLPLYLRRLLGCGLLLCACLPASAFAGALYKCAGPNGQVAYTNRPKTFVDCKVVSTYVDKPAPKHVAESTPHSEYRSEPASAAVASTGGEAPVPTAPAATADAHAQVSYGAVYRVYKANGISE